MKDNQINNMKERLKQVRREEHISQSNMAEKLGYPFETYLNYEKGKSRIPYEVLYDLHTKFGIDLNKFICGDDYKCTSAESIPDQIIALANQLKQGNN